MRAPFGISVPHMFVVTFVIMLPIAIKTGNPVKGWEAGLAWVFIQSFVLMAGGFVAPFIRKITPRAALLGTLAGVSIAFISLRPALEMFMTPVVGVPASPVHLGELVRRRSIFQRDTRWPGGHRRGHSHRLWALRPCRLNFGGSQLAKGSRRRSATSVSPSPCPPFSHVFGGFNYFGVHLRHRHPLRHLRLVEAIDNVESAAVAETAFRPRAFYRRWCRQSHRLPHGRSLHQRRLHRTPRMESDGWAHRLLRRHRYRRHSALVARLHFGDGLAGAGRRHLADPALYRDADRFTGVPGDPQAPRAGDHFGPDAPRRQLGEAANRQCARSCGHQRRSGRVWTNWGKTGCSTKGSACWARARSWAASFWERSVCSSSIAIS